MKPKKKSNHASDKTDVAVWAVISSVQVVSNNGGLHFVMFPA